MLNELELPVILIPSSAFYAQIREHRKRKLKPVCQLVQISNVTFSYIMMTNTNCGNLELPGSLGRSECGSTRRRGGGADDAHSDRRPAAATPTTTAAARGRSGGSLSGSSNVTSCSGGHGPANKKKKTSQKQSTFLDFLPNGKFGSRSGGIIARTKKEVWQAVTVLVADNMFPFHCVERPSFKWFIDFMQTGRKPPSRTSLMRKLCSLYDLNKVRLLDVLTGIQYVATTCDLWSARHK